MVRERTVPLYSKIVLTDSLIRIQIPSRQCLQKLIQQECYLGLATLDEQKLDCFDAFTKRIMYLRNMIPGFQSFNDRFERSQLCLSSA